LPDSFRIQAVDSGIKKKNLKGLIETVPGLRTNLFHFDSDILDINKLIYEIKKIEDEFMSIDDIIINSRVIHLPIAFEDSETKKAVEKYVKEVRSDASNVIDGYNIKFIALCNGITVDEVKKMILATEWYNSGCGFWPGGGFFWPMDPRCALVVPKYNPPRIWTPEGAVGIGGPCIFTYTTPTGGGYQLFGRTIPTFQFSQKHPLFKISPFLYQSADRIKFHETTEDEILQIFEHVHDKTDYKYEIKESEIIVREYLDFYNSENVQKGVCVLKHKQEEAKKRISEL
jgi:allophanate hydrolase subunit 1